MLSNDALQFHYHPKKGWLNDPNGLSFFNGEYHIFYQYQPYAEWPRNAMTWGHATTKDFLHFKELAPALVNDMPYDQNGVWSGTAIEHEGRLYAFYASVSAENRQAICVAYSDDGVHFTKYDKNPVITDNPFPNRGNFRDPAVMKCGEDFYLVVASANDKRQTGVLLLYHAKNCFDWQYVGVIREYEDSKFCECPSFLPYGDGYMLAVSVCKQDCHYFEVLYGDFDGKEFTPRIVSHFQKGPDEYAGQVFPAPDGRAILISWVSGWKYQPQEKCIGCLSLPLELTVKNGIVMAYPVQEVRHLVGKDGTVVDAYVKETYVRGGEEVYIELLEKP